MRGRAAVGLDPAPLVACPVARVMTEPSPASNPFRIPPGGSSKRARELSRSGGVHFPQRGPHPLVGEPLGEALLFGGELGGDALPSEAAQASRSATAA